jgi:hypothetical protein
VQTLWGIGPLVGAAIAVAAVGAWFKPHGWPATILVLAVSAVILALAARRPSSTSERTSTALRRGLILWSALAAAGLAWEAYAFVRQPDWSRADPVHPTISTLLDPVLEHGPLRIVGWLLWLAAGWRLVIR